jgi:hypothetical protein
MSLKKRKKEVYLANCYQITLQVPIQFHPKARELESSKVHYSSYVAVPFLRKITKILDFFTPQ